jgi:hypothetical protein
MQFRCTAKSKASIMAICAIAGLVASPCAAAGLESPGPLERGSGAFAGAYVRLPLSRQSRLRPKPEVGLRMGMTRVYRSPGAGGADRRSDADLLNFGFRTDGKMAFSIAGRSMLNSEGRLSFDGDGHRGGPSKGLLIAGGIVLVVGVGALLVIDKYSCSVKEDLAHKCEISD